MSIYLFMYLSTNKSFIFISLIKIAICCRCLKSEVEAFFSRQWIGSHFVIFFIWKSALKYYPARMETF